MSGRVSVSVPGSVCIQQLTAHAMAMVPARAEHHVSSRTCRLTVTDPTTRKTDCVAHGAFWQVEEIPESTMACSATGLPVLSRDPISCTTASRALPRGGSSKPYVVSYVHTKKLQLSTFQSCAVLPIHWCAATCCHLTEWCDIAPPGHEAQAKARNNRDVSRQS